MTLFWWVPIKKLKHKGCHNSTVWFFEDKVSQSTQVIKMDSIEVEKKKPGRPPKVWTEEELAAKEAKKAAMKAEKAAAKAAKKALSSAEKEAKKALSSAEKEAMKDAKKAAKKSMDDKTGVLAELLACPARITALIAKISE